MFKKLFLIFAIAANCSICFKLEPIKHYDANAVNSLQQDISEFLSIIPTEDIRNLTEHFYKNDRNMRSSYDYVRNEGARKIRQSLMELSIVQKFSAYLNGTGINYTKFDKELNRMVLTNVETNAIIGRN